MADVGCGHGASTLVLARAFPGARFIGFDYHAGSVEARASAPRVPVSPSACFEVAAAKEFPGSGYDLVCSFDCLHDMGDPVGAARHVRESLRSDGTWLIVEPFANDRLEDHLDPLGEAGGFGHFCAPQRPRSTRCSRRGRERSR